jgi:hypothetical protein
MFFCVLETKIKLPSSLNMYRVYFKDGTCQMTYGNGGTNAWYIAKQRWPDRTITDVEQLGDEWKN